MRGGRVATRTVGVEAPLASPLFIPKEAMQKLPVPHGADEYSGFEYIGGDGGNMRKRLFVAQIDGEWVGEWETGGSQRERVRIVLLSNNRFTIYNVEGRHTTVFQGSVNRHGILSGQVKQDGVLSGRFKLWPMKQEPSARRMQELYLKLRCGHCHEVPILEQPEGLPGQCCICLEDFAPGEMISSTSCSKGSHTYHRDCIQEWLKSHHTCPVCRSVIATPKHVSDEVPATAMMFMMRR